MYRYRLYKKQFIIAAIVILVIAGIGIAMLLMQQKNQSGSDTSQQKTVEKPSFTTLLPKGKTIDQLGGWQRISPSNTAPVYAFTDSINGQAITVSQQELPSSFKADVTGKTAELAKQYSATEEIKADAITAYLGSSAKGPQSLIFTKNNVLVLIKSEKKITNDAWKSYINSLE